MEAFDQPWKARYEGSVGAYWGIYDVERKPKFEFVAPIVRVPAWQTLAGISVAIAAVLLGMFYMNSSSLGTRGRSLLAIPVAQCNRGGRNEHQQNTKRQRESISQVWP